MKRFTTVALLAAGILSTIYVKPALSAEPLLFTPPAGWNATPGDTLMSGMLNMWQAPLPFSTEQFKLVGMWTGAEPMQMLTFAQGSAVASPGTIAKDFPSRDVSQGQVQYHVATQPYTFCGFPGTLVNVRFGGPMGFVMAYDLAVTQDRSTSYMLSYIHMAGESDPAAERALRSLCPHREIPRTQS